MRVYKNKVGSRQTLSRRRSRGAARRGVSVLMAIALCVTIVMGVAGVGSAVDGDMSLEGNPEFAAQMEQEQAAEPEAQAPAEEETAQTPKEEAPVEEAPAEAEEVSYEEPAVEAEAPVGSNEAEIQSDEPAAEAEVQFDVYFYDQDGNENQHIVAAEGTQLDAKAVNYTAPVGTRLVGWFEQDATEPYDFTNRIVTGELELHAVVEAVTPEEEAEAVMLEAEADVVEAGAQIVEQYMNVLEDEEDEPVAGTVYTVVFTVDGKDYKTVEAEANTLLDLSAPEVKKEEPFRGWYLAEEDVPFSASRLVTSNLTLEARFNDHVLVTYLDVDGSQLDVFEIDKDTKATKTKETVTEEMGKQFTYWTLDGVQYDFDARVTEDITLVPEMKDLALAVFITQGSEIDPQTGEFGFQAKQPADPTREGYKFDGWFADEKYTKAFDFATPIEGTVFIYAKWTPGKANYTVNFWAEKANIDTPKTTDLAYYDLVYTKMVTGATVDQPVTYNADTAKAEWSDNTAAREILYFCDYNRDLNDEIETQTVSGLGDTVINVFYTRSVFKFTFDVRSPNTNAKIPLEAEIFTGEGVPRGSLYTIDVKLGQDVSDIWPSSVEVTKYDTQPNTTYVMSNWSSYYGNGNNRVISVSDLNVGFSASAKPGRSLSIPKTITAPKIYELTVYPALISKANAYFETRYYYTEISKDDYDVAKDNNEDVKAWTSTNAKYGGERYYRFAKKGVPSPQNSDPKKYAQGWPGAEIAGYETIGKEGSGFTCITTQFQQCVPDEANGDRYYNLIYYMPAKQYGLTLVMDGGTINDAASRGLAAKDGNYTKSVAYTTDMSTLLPTDPDSFTKANFEFKGWYTDENMHLAYNMGAMPANAMTLYAKFVGTDVKVNYVVGSQVIRTNPYSMNDKLISHNLVGTAYENVKKGDKVPGKGTFKGWFYDIISDTAKATVEFPLGLQLSKQEYVLTAAFDPEVYEVTFMEDQADGNYELMTEVDVASGSNNTLAKSGQRPIMLKAEGYTFKGWSTRKNAETVNFSTATPITGNVTVYPVWKINSYEVEYLDGAPAGTTATNMPETSKHVFKSTVTVAGAPAVEGYTFQGWKNSADGATYDAGATFEQPAKNLSLTAQWKPNTYTVTFDKNGGDTQAAPNTKTVTVPNTTLGSLPTQPTRAGYSFEGWNTLVDGTGEAFVEGTPVTGDITVYAQWKVIPVIPTPTPEPTPEPTAQPTPEPSTEPTAEPTDGPTPEPSATPTKEPAAKPSTEPTADPTTEPTAEPTTKPINGSKTPAAPTKLPAKDQKDGPVDEAMAELTATTTPAAAAVVNATVAQPETQQQEEKNDTTNAMLGVTLPEDDAQPPSGTTINDGKIPLFGNADEDTWALLNLIMAAGGVVVAIALIVTRMAGQKNNRDDRRKKKVRPVWFVLSLVLGIVGVIAFLLTEEVSNIVVWMDNWTVLMAVVLGVEVISAVASSKKEDDEKRMQTRRMHTQEG